jgi:hypothetical protein
MIFSGPIILADLSRPLAQRKRKLTGPYRWTPQDRTRGGPHPGRGGYVTRGEFCEGSGVRLRLCEAPSKYAGGWSDLDGAFTVLPMVARLPGGRGFLAGCGEGEQLWCGFDGHIWAEESEAWRAAHDHAESACDRMVEESEEFGDDD